MAEVEERIARISKHKGVVGIFVVDDSGKILRQTIKMEKDQDGKEIYPKDISTPQQIAIKVSGLAKKARSVVRDIDPHNDLTFFRVRGKNKQEILVAPDKNLFLIVIQRTEFEEQWALIYKLENK